jgi:hypothetical protein
MFPSLVEPTIHSILQHELKNSHQKKFERDSLYLNVGGFLFLFSLIGLILWVHYKGKQDISAQRLRERKKREYILSKLNEYQRIKNQEYSGIPFLSH